MRYLPHTDQEISEMLKTVGCRDLEALFASIPANCKSHTPLNIPEAISEWELNREMDRLAGQNAKDPEYQIYIGAGSYHHHIPAVIPYLLARSEFSTAYTPYQPEMSQGTLQAIYEYQTLISRYLGMDIANASLYDGASALAETLLTAIRITKKKRVALSNLIHPYYRRVVATYFAPTGYEIIELPYLPDGRTDLDAIDGLDDLATVAIQSPNFFGCIEDLNTCAQKIRQSKALFTVCFTEALAFGLLKNPGDCGADLVCGEGQSLGMTPSFGGPALGVLACKEVYMRQIPGRLVGKTQDQNGCTGFVLTLSTREQHIRREKATSNICTNSSLNALAAAIYLSTLGKSGMRELAQLNLDKNEYLKQGLQDKGIQIAFASPTFNEFVMVLDGHFADKHESLINDKIVPGLALEPFYPELAGHYLICATETKTKNDLDQLIQALAKP